MIVVDNPTFWETVFRIRGSTWPMIWRRMLAVTVISVVVTVMHTGYGLLRHDLTVVPFTLIGIALSIFLGFRNGASYDRFWEGRRLWGQLVNTTRSLTRQTLTLIRPPGGTVTTELESHRRAIVYRLIAFTHALRAHLRDEDPLLEVAPWLSEAEVDALRPETNRPIAIVQRLGDVFREDLDRGWVDRFHLPLLEESLVELTSIQGGCERIKATPIPFSYSILLHGIVGVYCLGLPFGLVEVIGPFTPIVVLMVAYAFFGLDAVGGEIENPFGLDPNDLPLSALSRTIEINLRQRLGDTDLPPPMTPVSDVLS
jgi:putative membrane protein